MKKFQYIVTDPIGLHARPAGLLATASKEWSSHVSVESEKGRQAPADRLIALLALEIKQGDTVTFVVEGGDEEETCCAVRKFCFEHL